jgi:hypothetical protein
LVACHPELAVLTRRSKETIDANVASDKASRKLKLFMAMITNCYLADVNRIA